MSYRPRRFEDDIYPDDEYDEYPEYEPDPDHQRDLQMEREWDEGRAQDILDDPYPWGQAPEWRDEYMDRTYGRGPGR